MRNFIVGFVLGGLLLGSITAVTVDPRIIGGSGTLYGVTVVDENGDDICYAPSWDSGTKDLTCD